MSLFSSALAQNTFTPLQQGDPIPQNVTDLWKDYDPSKEAIDKEIVTTFEEDGIICEYVLFTVATFKGTPSRIAAYYTYPKGSKNLPAFVWAHGGGQKADKKRGFHFAKKGFATLDLNWNGRELESGIEKNTDWGNIDPTQGKPYYAKAPRAKRNTGIKPDDYTVDPIVSPRNKYWFMLAAAGRRGITFLEQQEQVDPDCIGFTGFSMGGNITAFCAIDARLKAVAPIVGGSGHRYDEIPGYPLKKRKSDHQALENKTIVPNAYWPHVTAPVLFISGTNDFHGRYDFLQKCANALPEGTRWNMSQTLHNNHSPGPMQNLALEYWFNTYLKIDNTDFPETPQSSFSKESETSWKLSVTPDDLKSVKAVHFYYSWDSAISNRFHKPITATRVGNSWEASIPSSQELPLTAFADIVYQSRSRKAEQALNGESDTFSITSRFYRILPKTLTPQTFTNNTHPRTFEPVFAEFPKDNLIWSKRAQDQSILTYKFNDQALDFPANKKLQFKVNPHGKKMNLVVSFSSSKNRLKEKNQLGGRLSIRKTFTEPSSLTISLADLVKKDQDGKEEQITAWPNISTMSISLQNLETKKKANLLDPSPKHPYLKRIEWVD